MPKRITPATRLRDLKKEAKRWLKALRADEPEARNRLRLAYPSAPSKPKLRDVQLALWAATKVLLMSEVGRFPTSLPQS